MKCPEYLFKDFDLDGLPEQTNVHWNHLEKDIHSIHNDEDTVWLELPNGLGIDAGCYGWNRQPPYKNFRIEVVFTLWHWHCVEYSICISPEEAASEIVRLSNKWNKPEMLEIARRIAHRKAKRRKKGKSDY